MHLAPNNRDNREITIDILPVVWISAERQALPSLDAMLLVHLEMINPLDPLYTRRYLTR